MLYVFQMDVGQMLTFDISLLMDTVSRLQLEIAKATGIAVDKQILLVSGGHSLKPDQKVMTYGAGADTNPVFLFSKLAIENQEPPLVRSFGVQRELLVALREKISEARKFLPTFETVAIRTKLACQIRDSASKMHQFCNNEFKEQHLQNQGWGTVVANLEEIAQAMQKTAVKFSKAFTAFLPSRGNHFTMLENYTVELLDRIPLIKGLKEEEDQEINKQSIDPGIISFVASSETGPSTLLEWITTQGQGQSLEALQRKCYEDLHMLNEEMFEACDRQVQNLLSIVNDDPRQMKELLGIGPRLSGLEKRLNETKKIAKEQIDMAQGFLNHQASLNSTKDAVTILPDLCKSHQFQLEQMLERQQRLEGLQNSFRKSKQEMSTNIHQRLVWVMHVETEISKVDSDLIFHMKTLRVLECNLELLSQVKASPEVYANMVMEAGRRKIFSHKFLQWAEGLAEDSRQLYKSEIEKRKHFAKKLGEHFLLNTLFKGFEDMPPNFATKSPQPFDVGLPDITVNDIAYLKDAVPELEGFLSLSVEAGSFPVSSKRMTDSLRLQMVTPHSQSSQTEWTDQALPQPQPSVIVATEAPPTKFALPELQESVATEYMPALSSLTETMRDVMSSAIKPATKSSGNATSESSNSAAPSDINVDESAVPMHSVKTQTKTNSTNTDSTSPLSSTEFATADFYFEDSMPSPRADSPLDKKEHKKMDSSKTDSELVASLQAELAEKLSLIKELELKLKESSPKLSIQKNGSSDESATLISKSTVSDPALTSDSGGVMSSDSSNVNVVSGPGKHETSGGDVSAVDTSDSVDPEKLVADNQPARLTSEDSIRIKKLEWELELANTDLCKFKESVFEAATKLQEVQSQHEITLLGKNSHIQELEDSIKKISGYLAAAKEDILNRDVVLDNFEKDLGVSQSRVKSLEQELKESNSSMERIRLRLLELRDILKVDIPSFRQSLAELREAVKGSKSDMESAIVSGMSMIEKQVSLFTTSVLSDAYAEFSKEKAELRTEIQQLKLKLNQSQSESCEKQAQLNSKNEELTSQMERQDGEFIQKLKEQREEFDGRLKDLKTQHALEMELELDKCKADWRDSAEASERSIDSLTKLKDELCAQLQTTKASANIERENLQRAHEEKISTLEKTLAQGKEVEMAQLNQKFETEMAERVKESNACVSELEAKLEQVQANLDTEKEQAIASLKENLTLEHEAAMKELRQQVEDQKIAMTELLEQRQLEHVHKLTELKTHFDMERESLIAEMKKYQPRAKSDVGAQTHTSEKTSMETQTYHDKSSLGVQTEQESTCHIEVQTDYDLVAESLTHSNTQTEILDLMADAMTSSETQTGLELLADVISLTSSASYGSEEMIANRQSTATVDDKDNKETSDSVTKLQQVVDDLNSQLANAQEKIIILEKDITTLQEEKRDMVDARGGTEPSESRPAMAEQFHYQQMMQSSNTGASFMVMEKDQMSIDGTTLDTEVVKTKDQKIVELEKKLMEMSTSMTVQEREMACDKVSIRGCEKGHLVLLCLDERHDQYVVFTVGTNLHFLHSDSLECLGLKSGGDPSCRKSWILAEVIEKEYCLAKKPNNRFRVPQGTCFYRVKCKPWKNDIDQSRQEKELAKQTRSAKSEHGVGARPKKTEKK